MAIEELVTAHADDVFRGSKTYAGYFAAAILEGQRKSAVERDKNFHLLRDMGGAALGAIGK